MTYVDRGELPSIAIEVLQELECATPAEMQRWLDSGAASEFFARVEYISEAEVRRMYGMPPRDQS